MPSDKKLFLNHCVNLLKRKISSSGWPDTCRIPEKTKVELQLVILVVK